MSQKKETKGPIIPVSKYRRALPQILASSAKNLILFDNSLVLSFSTIAIDALLDSPGKLSFNSSQASWFASISYMCQPLGSLGAGLLMEPLGRKRSMLLLNIPFLTAWLLLYFAPDIAAMYAAAFIMGLGVGCTEAPILTYVGEISEPSLRGVMTCYAQLCGALGYVLLYLAGAFLSWRDTALACASIPVLTFLSILWVPETPAWLVSRGRVRDAEKALCWLRGWVSPPHIEEEFNQLLEHHNCLPAPSNSSSETLIKDPEDHGMKARLKFLLKKEMRRPLFIIVAYFFFYYLSGLNSLRPYMIPVFRRLGISMDPHQATVWVSVLGLAGNAVCMCSVAYTGKRALSVVSFLLCAVSTLLLALVAFGLLRPVVALPAFLSLSFFTGLGAAPIPWMLQSELFPFRGRSLGSSIAAAISYLIGFCATKTFLSLEELLGLDGVFFLYTGFSLLGALYLYICLPETEGRSLHDIEQDFKKG